MPNNERKNGISGTIDVNTFLITVVLVTKLNDWKIIPTLFLRNLRRDFPFNFVTSIPSTVNFPSLISSIRLIVRINVDLPAPESPIIDTNSPCSISKLIFLRPLTPFG